MQQLRLYGVPKVVIKMKWQPTAGRGRHVRGMEESETERHVPGKGQGEENLENGRRILHWLTAYLSNAS